MLIRYQAILHCISSGLINCYVSYYINGKQQALNHARLLMKSGYNMTELRRKDKQITTEDAAELLSNTAYGILLIVGGGGQPYGVPLKFVYKDNALYFHCALTGHNHSQGFRKILSLKKPNNNRATGD